VSGKPEPLPGLRRWEYARLESTDDGVGVVFSHRPAWPRQAPDAFFDTLRRLGDEGWELVSALPLGGTGTLTMGAGGPPGPGGGSSPAGQTRAERAEQVTMRLGTDRWLMFKRTVPEPPPSQGTTGEDLLKGVISRQILKGRLPLP
jgi:hypothetical protein